jgi:hypothetical protein
MRWLVEAADSKTGMETEITVEARSEADAERLALYNGLLVWKITRVGPRPAPVVPYRGTDAAGPPQYLQVLRSAAWVRRIGLVAGALGWAGLLVSLGAFSFLCMRAGWDNWKSWQAWLVPSAAATWRWAVAASACVVLGAVLRRMAAVAAAVRDVARNTYKPEATVESVKTAGDKGAEEHPEEADGGKNGETAVVSAA